MDSVIIVTHRVFGLGQLRRLIPTHYSVDETANERLAIGDGERRAYLGADARVAGEMEPEEASRITTMIPEPAFYTLDFSDIGMCRELLLAIADSSDVVIDNDHGVILPGSEFVRLLRNHRGWDWRRDPPP